MSDLKTGARPHIFRPYKTVLVALAGGFLGAALTLGIQSFGLVALGLSLPPLYVLYVSLRRYAERLEQEQCHGRQMTDLYLSVIETLALAIDARDRTTRRDIRRVQAFAVELGRSMKIPSTEIEALKIGTLLCDIGKLAVPEHILCKPGPLTREETEKMRIHVRLGLEILETIRSPLPFTGVVRSHHERWDGSGYPERLKGEEIPITARILAVVDCFDALTSERPHRQALDRDAALERIRREAGTSFDPAVVEALMKNVERFRCESGRLSASTLESIHSAQRELLALYDIARSTARSLSLDEAMGSIAARIAPLIHHRCLVLYVLDQERRLLTARYVHGLQTPRLGQHTIPLGQRMSGWAAAHRMPIHGITHENPSLPEGCRSDLEELQSDGALEGLESSIAAPLFDDDAVLGVLALYDRRDRAYEDDDLRVISIVSGHVAAAVRHDLRHGVGQGGALIDPLTRLPNARYLFVSFEEEIGRAVRQQVPLSIIELDVDHFSEVNDHHGHAAGDRILREVARLIRAQLRGCDTCVRYAADEFIVIVPGVGKQEVTRLRTRIQEAIENHKFAVHGGQSVRLSVNMGASSFPEDGKNFDALIAVADARLYDAKPSHRKADLDGSGYQRFTGRRSVPVN